MSARREAGWIVWLDDRIGLDRGLIFGLSALAFVLLAVYSRQTLAAAPSGLAVLLLSNLLVYRRWKLQVAAAPVIAVVAFCAWAGLSTIWSVMPSQTLAAALKGGLIIGSAVFAAGAAALSPQEQRRLSPFMIAAGLLFLLLMTVERAGGLRLATWLLSLTGEQPPGWLPWLNPAAAMLAVSIWLPIACVLERRWLVPAILIWAWAAGLFAMLASGSAAIAFAVASLVYAISRIAPRTGMVLIMGSVPVALILVPILVVFGLGQPSMQQTIAALPFSQQHRVVVLEFSTQRFLDRPLLGWGADASRAVPGGARQTRISVLQSDGTRKALPAKTMPMHPHNSAMQLLLELGLVGGALFSLFWIVVVGRVLRRAAPGPTRAAVSASLAGIVTVACLAHGFWDFGLLGAYGAVIAAGTALLRRSQTA